MSYIPIQGIALPSVVGLKELQFKQLESYSILSTDISSAPHFFKKWELELAGESVAQALRAMTVQVSGIMKRDSGAGDVDAGFFVSTDNINWVAFVELGGANSPVEFTFSSGGQNFPITNTFLYFAFIALNTNGSTTGTIRNMSFDVLIDLPPKFTFTRLI